MELIRILIVGMPCLASDMIADALRRQSDMTVVQGPDSTEALPRAVEQADPDVVVIGGDRWAMAAEVPALLLRRPTMKVLGLETTGGGQGHLFEMRPQHVAIGSLTPLDLVSAVRSAVKRRPQAVDMER